MGGRRGWTSLLVEARELGLVDEKGQNKTRTHQDATGRRQEGGAEPEAVRKEAGQEQEPAPAC